MNQKLKNIYFLLENIQINSFSEGLSDIVDRTGQRVQRIEDRLKAIKQRAEDVKFKAKKKVTDAKLGDYELGKKVITPVLGGVKQGISKGVEATQSGIQKGSELADSDLGSLMLASLGLHPNAVKFLADKLNKGIELATNKKELSQEEQDKIAKKQLDILRRNEGKNYRIEYEYTGNFPDLKDYYYLLNKRYPRDSNKDKYVDYYPIKALSKKDAEGLFNQHLEKNKDRDEFNGIKFEIKKIL